jgi:glucose/arabinose dehydrogenase
MRRLFALSALVAGSVAAQTPAPAAPAGPCGAYPALAGRTIAGWCTAAVATREHGLRMPRTVLWLGRSGDIDELLVADMGGWDPKRGRLLHLAIDTRKKTVRTKALLSGLDRPHGLRKGPDGWIWLGETTKISRFAWKGAGQPVLPETVIDQLPAQGRHPLKEFAFGPDKALYLNAGAPDDRCAGKASTAKDGLPACPAMSGARPLAAVYRARFEWPQGKLQQLEPFATGLRNSMGLVVHPSGTVLQAENSIDLDEEDQPPEEINRLQPGGHYGWPGCVGDRKPMPGTPARTCARTVAPALAMPAHAAPLHLQYSHASFGGPAGPGLLVSWHGWRPAGQRMVRYAIAPDGMPVGPPTELAHWLVDAGEGRTLAAAPVGWAEDTAGQLWIADDRNRMIVWLRRK